MRRDTVGKGERSLGKERKRQTEVVVARGETEGKGNGKIIKKKTCGRGMKEKTRTKMKKTKREEENKSNQE